MARAEKSAGVRLLAVQSVLCLLFLLLALVLRLIGGDLFTEWKQRFAEGMRTSFLSGTAADWFAEEETENASSAPSAPVNAVFLSAGCADRRYG